MNQEPCETCGTVTWQANGDCADLCGFCKLRDELTERKIELKAVQRNSESLLRVVKMAYRKHHLEDKSIGWNELSDVLHNALCNSIGDAGFRRWLLEQKR